MPANLEEPKKTQANEQYSIRKGASAMFSKQDRSKSSISKSFNQNMTSQDSPHKESEFEDEKIEDDVNLLFISSLTPKRKHKKLKTPELKACSRISTLTKTQNKQTKFNMPTTTLLKSLSIYKLLTLVKKPSNSSPPTEILLPSNISTVFELIPSKMKVITSDLLNPSDLMTYWYDKILSLYLKN